MTTVEILLAIVTSLFTAKEIWLTVRNNKNKDTDVKLAEINSNHGAIEELKKSNALLDVNLKLIQAKYSEIKVAFSIIYPSLEKLMKDDPTQKKTLEKLYEIIQED